VTPRAATLFWRAVRLRCPHCGGGPLFVGYARLLPACPSCGLTLQRGERGYWLGAYFMGLVAIEIVACAWLLGVMVWSWPDVPWRFLQVSAVVVLVGTSVGFYQMSHTIFLAFDLLVHPVEDNDFAAPEELRPIRTSRRER
jgi:uncharacterized protein (DUF983 family)